MQRKNEGSFWGSSLGIFEGVIFLTICHFTLHADFGLNLWMGCDSSAEHQAATSLTVPDRLFQALCFWKTALVSFVLGFSGPSTVSSRQLVSINIGCRKRWMVPAFPIGYNLIHIWGKLSHPTHLYNTLFKLSSGPLFKETYTWAIHFAKQHALLFR